MGRLLKPFVGPMILVMAEIGLGMTSYQSDWLGGILIGVAIFWVIFALLSNKALMKKFPGILEWAPFLDPTGIYAGSDQLMGKYISQKNFSINNVPYSGMIEGRTFEDCHILGPAVIHLCGTTTFYENKHEIPIIPNWQDATYTVISDSGIIGAVIVKDCVFRRCKFSKISFAGNKIAGDIMIEQIKSGLPKNP